MKQIGWWRIEAINGIKSLKWNYFSLKQNHQDKKDSQSLHVYDERLGTNY